MPLLPRPRPPPLLLAAQWFRARGGLRRPRTLLPQPQLLPPRLEGEESTATTSTTTTHAPLLTLLLLRRRSRRSRTSS